MHICVIEQNPVVKSDRVFLLKIEKEVVMWFLIIVLLLISILNAANREEEMIEEDVSDLEGNRVVHPAEYLMR